MMLTGQAPFNGDKIYDSIIAGKYEFPADVNVSDDAKDLIAWMLTVDPDARLSASDALKHRWITSAHGYVPIKLPSMVHFSKIRGLGHFKKEALLAIGYTLCRDQIRDLSLTFRALDKDGTGVISIETLR